jgi:amino acid permease
MYVSTYLSIYVCMYLFIYLFLLLGIYFVYISNVIPKFPPQTPTPPPTHSHLLALVFPCTEAYKVCTINGPLFPLMADQAIFWYICS